MGKHLENGMTDFEQQVAEALRPSGSEIGMDGVQGTCERHGIDFAVACEMIRMVLDARAPRVAAAIERAMWDASAPGKPDSETREAALAALRGGTAGETETGA